MFTVARRKNRLVFIIGWLALAALLLSSLFVGNGSKQQDASKATAISASPSVTVILDAGHGGEDPGTTGKNGALEKDLNLTIVKELELELTKLGCKVVLTRDEDRLVDFGNEVPKGKRKITDLSNRVKISAETPGALFVSIHMNSFSDSSCNGLQIYYKNTDNESYSAAESIQRSVKTRLQTYNERKVKSDGSLYVLKNNPNVAVLIECGFLSNEKECEDLCRKEYQKELSFAIACGIMDYVQERNHTERQAI